MNKIFLTLFFVFNLFSVFYLVSPTPTLPPLRDAVVSDLPGDTTQLKNVSAYFTNLTRSEVINFYKANYGGLIRIELNHPPEKSRDLFVNTMQSYYLEEFVLPFKESIFINGYDWQNDVFTKPAEKLANKLIYHGIEYQSKITIKTYPTTIAQRLITFFATEFAIIAVFLIYKKVFFNK